eukprot:TRINITY_DN9234_c0_g1_i1.p3 TRINITY_DN9234_c0_g1~~TRINITY_DN9234_c0_g1_i1.p3  ORF type:complete len:56 (+),score=13.60 TRINITY_DN9234_c0_g1_i1:400-567(+)
MKKRKLKKNTKIDQRKRQKVAEPDIVLPPKPKILSGKTQYLWSLNMQFSANRRKL